MLHHLADKKSRKAGHKDTGAGCPHMLKDKLEWKKTVLAEQKGLAGTQEEKKDLWKKGQENQDCKDTIRLFKAKIRKVKAQIELILATAVKDKKIFVSFFPAVRGWLRSISSLYWMWGETK